MNKKIFTLLAASLMLLVTAFAANAGNGVGPKVNSLPDGVGLGAYHLKVTNLGYNNPLTGDSVLALDGNGHVFLADSLRLFDYGSADSTYLKLRQALWCVNVDRENQGKRPTFVFTNKEYGLDLSIASNNELSPLRPSAAQGQYMYYGQSSYQDNGVSGTEFVQFAYMPNTDSSYVVGGDQSNWRFSYDYSGSLSDTVYLAIADPNNDDYYFTLAWKSKSTNPNIGDIQLVRAHAFDLHDTAHFYKEHLILFSLHEAAPRVLSVEDFNSNLASQSTAGNIQLTFTPDAKNTDLINP
ncbi:MAG: hypothetical protein LBJ23_08985, partial [Tannerella sp.]|nr:hypothetical protein [Tannerella sp.]